MPTLAPHRRSRGGRWPGLNGRACPCESFGPCGRCCPVHTQSERAAPNMRPIPTLLALSLAALPAFASAADFDNWPTKYTFGDGTELAATANIAYDYNDFSSGSGLEDDDAVRRKEFGATLKKKGVYD